MRFGLERSKLEFSPFAMRPSIGTLSRVLSVSKKTNSTETSRQSTCHPSTSYVLSCGCMIQESTVSCQSM